MKHTLIIGAALTCLSMTAATEVRAQEAVVQTTTTRNLGTISEFGPDEMVIRSETAPDPIRYGFTKTTRYVDEDGVPVAIEQVKTGMPVTVEYARVGQRLIANRVIVRRAVTPTATVIEKAPTATVIERAPAPTVIERAPATGTVIEKKTTTTTTTERR